MSRRLEKLIEQKAWETLTDYGYNDAHLLEQLTESVLERLSESSVSNLHEVNVPNPYRGTGYSIIGPDADGNYYVQWYRNDPPGSDPPRYVPIKGPGGRQGPYSSPPKPAYPGGPLQIPGTRASMDTSGQGLVQLKAPPADVKPFSPDLRTANLGTANRVNANPGNANMINRGLSL